MSSLRCLTTTSVAALAVTGFVTIAGLMGNSTAVAEPVSWVSTAGSAFPQHQPSPNPDCPNPENRNCPGPMRPGQMGPGHMGPMGPGQMGPGQMGPMGPMGPGQMGPGSSGS